MTLPHRQSDTTILVHKGGILQLLKAYFSSNRIGEILVLEGKLPETRLQDALVIARAESRRLGEVLVEHRFVRRHDLYGALAKQFGIRMLAWAVALVVTVGSFAPRQTRADDRTGYDTVVTQTYKTASLAFGRSIRAYPALFGSAERKSADLSAFTKWTSMFDRYAREMDSAPARAMLASWQSETTAPLNGQGLTDMARRIDAAFNQIHYVEDRANYGKTDFWATPIEFLKNGGDCEDYAIAKYITLKTMGVAEDRLRIAIVHDMVKNIPHAILVVYTDDGPMILDNQSKVTRMASEVTRYKPIFSINATSWWLHTRGANVQVASAAH